MRFFLRGTSVPHRKNTALSPTIHLAPPSEVTIPTSMHIGKPAIPIVKAGDEVFVGTLIAEQDGAVSSPVHSSVSGKVKGIAEITLPNGVRCSAVKIESDGNMTLDKDIEPPNVTDKASLLDAVAKSGIVGLGGAGFPTHVKLNAKRGKEIKTLIVNGAECEPYITSDTRAMAERSEDMYRAISVICDILGIKSVIVGVERDNKVAIMKMKELEARDPKIRVSILPTLYPQGAEKVLVYHTMGKVIPAGKLPIDVGAVVSNCTTLAAIGDYLKNGIPLVSRCITVDGGSIASPSNVTVPVGTSVGDVIKLLGGFREAPYKVLLGGPMMGYSVEDLNTPVMKNTNAVLALSESESKPKLETACIHCGACVSHCPFSLNPRAYMYAYKRGDLETLERLRVDICMECGCCSFICPAGKPLVEINKLSKAKFRELAKEREEGGRVNG